MVKKPYRIKKGARIIGIATGGRPFPVVWANIFVDCSRCDESIGLKFNWDADEHAMDDINDEQAQGIFEKEGWTFKPTLCPKCQKAAQP
jgi:hypothetical protein